MSAMWQCRGRFAKSIIQRAAWVTGLLVCVLSPANARAAEVVESLHADITVASDGVLEVVESIDVRAEGVEFKRGIHRGYKLSFTDVFGKDHSVAYSVKEVTRNGIPENWSIKRSGDTFSVYVGSENQFLDAGLHRYRIRFTTDYQLGHGESEDELYWNVTGNGWPVAIQHAGVSVSLPGGIDEVEFSGFTGRAGSTERDIAARRNQGSVEAQTTRALEPGEGLTVHLRWPRGVVTRPEGATSFRETTWAQGPSLVDRIRGFFQSGFALLGLIAAALAWAWSRIGRGPRVDPVAGTIDRPPYSLGPAALRWADGGNCDAGVLLAALMSLASKGRIRIIDSGKDRPIEFERLNEDSHATTQGVALTPAESWVLENLFEYSSVVSLRRNERRVWQDLLEGLESVLEAEYRERFFAATNDAHFKVVGAVVIALMIWLFTRPDNATTSPIFVILGAVLLVVLFLAFVENRTRDGKRLKLEVDAFRKYLAEGERISAHKFDALWPYAAALDVADDFSIRADVVQPSWYVGAMSGAAGPALAQLKTTLDRDLSRYSKIDKEDSGFSSSSSGSSGGAGSAGGGGGGGASGGW